MTDKKTGMDAEQAQPAGTGTGGDPRPANDRKPANDSKPAGVGPVDKKPEIEQQPT